MDPKIQRKHQAMLERLANRHQSRSKANTEIELSPEAETKESSSSFTSKFSDLRRSIESQISSMACCNPDAARYKPELSSISVSISSLEQLLAESSYFLCPYDIRSSLQCINDLKLSLDSLNATLIPKKKFSFKSKSGSDSGGLKSQESSASSHDSIQEPLQSAFYLRESPGFRDRANETLMSSVRDSEVSEFSLSRLNSCEVRLTRKISALFVDKLKACKVYTGPVVGSVLVEDVEDCVFVLASHQIRIHNAKRCDFYLRVRSRPIIEDCTEVRFGPYCLSYVMVEEDLKDAALDKENGCWANVDDFKWLKSIKSPNWSVLEESERINVVLN